MAFADWNTSYTVHDKELDGQHQHLFSIVSELHKTLLTRYSKEQIGRVIATLLKYTQDHFAAEERLMESSGYPGLPGHKLAHETLIQQVSQFEKELRTSDASVAPDVFVFLVKEWLVGHILGMDKNFALFSSARRSGSQSAERPSGRTGYASALLPAMGTNKPVTYVKSQ